MIFHYHINKNTADYLSDNSGICYSNKDMPQYI